MKTWLVHVPVSGYIPLEVVAETAEEAIEMANIILDSEEPLNLVDEDSVLEFGDLDYNSEVHEV